MRPPLRPLRLLLLAAAAHSSLLAAVEAAPNAQCPTNSTPVVCLGGPGTPPHGKPPCQCPSNYDCIDSTTKHNCTLDSYYCACSIVNCIKPGGHCVTGADCCETGLPAGFSAYCGGLTPPQFTCTLKLENCSGTKCPQGATHCCGPTCLTPENQCCDPAKGVYGPQCCGTVPFGPGNTCCSGTVVPSRKCCHGQIYDPDSGHQQCCPNGPCTIPPGKSSCCP